MERNRPLRLLTVPVTTRPCGEGGPVALSAELLILVDVTHALVSFRTESVGDVSAVVDQNS
jgi:hypothetical protein